MYVEEYIKLLNLAVERTLKKAGWSVPTEEQIRYLANIMVQKGVSPDQYGLGNNSKRYLSKSIFDKILNELKRLQ